MRWLAVLLLGVSALAGSALGFQSLMDEGMARMHSGMAAARMTGSADQDFLGMMIPHQQGAVDAAKAVLLYGRDPQVKRLAQEILTEEALEIEYMHRLQQEKWHHVCNALTSCISP